ncbi:MAG: metallophosphoesterase family protein [Lachnospiraceae bacterium]|nr:metallophosphoesterase family protein [Lachnospiraceae bacterium]
MRILVIADEESKSLWDYFEKEKLEGIDLIISCGDLSPHYLSFLATFTKAPVIYVHGNHDGRYETTPPDGCICIEDEIYNFKGLRILGLGGCMKYKPGPHMYTQKEMKKRVKKLRWKLFRSRGFDILVTHAPALHLNDGDDMPHRGFESFISLMDKYHPKVFLHGHVHANYGGRYKRESTYNETRVINAYEKYEFEIDDALLKQ